MSSWNSFETPIETPDKLPEDDYYYYDYSPLEERNNIKSKMNEHEVIGRHGPIDWDKVPDDSQLKQIMLKKSMENLIEKDITTEKWREYDFSGRTYRIENPKKLILREGGATHRVVDAEGVVHCLPAPGKEGCVLRWKSIGDNPVSF